MHGNTKDLTGLRYGKLTVIENAGSDKNGHARWLCKCDCGNKKVVTGTNLIRGLTTSCGCEHRRKVREIKHYRDITGERFGLLVAKSIAGIDRNGDARWNCICDCGNITVAKYRHLICGEIKSCGCWKNAPKKHGMTVKGKRPRIYGIWEGMKQRCTNPNVDRYPRYGGRGIEVCQEWMNDFEAFYKWAMANGYADDLTIDRIDNDGNYTPDNCRWVTIAENLRNR